MPTAVTVSNTVVQEVVLNTGHIYASVDPLKINIDPFKYDIGGLRGTFAGVLGQSVTDNSANYLYLSSSGTLVVNTTGFPDDDYYLALGRVVAYNGEIVATFDERILIATAPVYIGTCVLNFPVDGGIRGGSSGVSSNNDRPSVTFAASGMSTNRWNIRPPQNYASGDLVFRCLGSVAGSPGSNAMRVGLNWTFDELDEVMSSSFDYNSEYTKSLSEVSNDELFAIDFTISSLNFDKTKDQMSIWFYRDGDHEEDTTGLTLHTHLCGLRYTGYTLAGQAGQ
jgi:hypothetical protein